MQRRAHFGLRASQQPAVPRRTAPAAHPAPAVAEAPRTAIPPAEFLMAPPDDDEVARDIAEWKSKRKIRKRSFREPWRTLSIVSGIGFGLSFWLLPDSVANIAQLVTLGLTAAAFFAGFRKVPAGEKQASGNPQLPRP